MSHLATVKTKIRDRAAIVAACHRLGLAVPLEGTARLYSGTISGLIVQLPGWQYPVAVDTTTGDIAYDNFEGHWGDQARLDQFVQAYAVEKTKLEAKRKGLAVSEQSLQDGSVKLQIRTGD
jgi:hypothetical protein